MALSKMLDNALAQALATEAKAALADDLAAALKQVEFVSGFVDDYCPWCKSTESPHTETCVRQAALARYDAEKDPPDSGQAGEGVRHGNGSNR